MHTGQLFPAVCFWKNLIPDAVKYWFSLTSVKALIFLLRLNNLSNKIFLPFWASINDLTRTPSFHIAVSNKTAALLILSSLPSPLSFYSKTSFGGSGREIICPRVKSSDLYSVILGCITSNFLYLNFPLCILVLRGNWLTQVPPPPPPSLLSPPQNVFEISLPWEV